MFKKIKKIGREELIKGSLVLFILMNIFNFLNYVFHFSMARLLGPSDYGVLAVLMSIVYIYSIPSEAIQTIISKYTSQFNIKKQQGKIKDLYYRSLKKGFKLALIIFIILIPISIFLSNFLDIKFSLIFFTNFLVFYVFAIPISRGVLQGRKLFIGLGLNMVSESLTKVVLAVILVLVGWKVYGAVEAMLIAGVLSFLLALVMIKDLFKKKRKHANVETIYVYGMPVFISIIAIVLMYSLDIIIAKRFFTPEIAGKYAVASMFGKIIFFGTYAIGKAMFPLTTEGHESGKNTKKIFKKSLKIVIIFCIAALFFYLFFPELIIKVLFGEEYIQVANILFTIGLTFTFISLSNILILYNLSINKMKKSAYTLLIFVIIEIIVLSIFSNTLEGFSLSFLGVSILMFVYNLILLKK